MPILLLLLMFGLARYLFAGQFATYVAISDLHSELLHLQAANDALAAQLFPLEASGKLTEQVTEQFTRASDERFPGRTVTVSRGGKGFVLSTEGAPMATAAGAGSRFYQRRLHWFRRRSNALHLRAIRLSPDRESP